MAMHTRLAHVCTVALALVGGARLAAAACTPPQALGKQLRIAPRAETYADLGTWYAQRKEFDCAADAFRRAADLQPDSARFHSLLGLSLYSAGKARDAVGPLHDAVRLDPNTAATYTTLGAALDASGERGEAEAAWRRSLALEPSSVVALESLARDLLADGNYAAVIALLRRVEGTDTFTDELAVDLSAAYSKSGLLEDAAQVLEVRLKASPTSLPVAEALSGVLILQSRFEDAVHALAPVVEQHRSDQHAQVLYLQVLVLAHDPAADSFGQHLLASDARAWEVLYFLGVLHQGDDDYAGARDYFRRALAGKPDYADAHYRLGTVLADLKDNAAAKGELEQAAKLGLDTPELHAALAKALRSTGDVDAAQQQFALYREKQQLQEAHAQAADKAQQADRAAAAGNWQQTAEDYREALVLDPHEPVLAYKLALALDRVGDRAGERAALAQALALDPRMALALDQLGFLESADGNTHAATRDFQLAVQADPGLTQAWVNLAASLCLDAKWQAAREALDSALALDPDNARAKALLEKMDQLQAQR